MLCASAISARGDYKLCVRQEGKDLQKIFVANRKIFFF